MVRTTSSKFEHVPFVIVHRRVTLAPAVSPVTVLPAEEGAVTTAPFAAPTTLQAPVPTSGALATRVKLAALHSSWSAPAVAVVGNASLVSTTSSKVEHVPLAIVHLSVTLVPAFNPVTVVVGELILVMTAPLAAPWIVQVPAPGPAAFAASVKIDVLQKF